MNDVDAARSDGEELKILVIHAQGCPPDEATLGELLDNTGLVKINFATLADIADESINPKDFDRILVILRDEIETDEQLEACMKNIAACRMGAIGIWDKDTENDEMHPVVQKYGIRQIPWDSNEIHQAIASNTPKEFKSSGGSPIKQSERHKTTHNNC